MHTNHKILGFFLAQIGQKCRGVTMGGIETLKNESRHLWKAPNRSGCAAAISAIRKISTDSITYDRAYRTVPGFVDPL